MYLTSLIEYFFNPDSGAIHDHRLHNFVYNKLAVDEIAVWLTRKPHLLILFRSTDHNYLIFRLYISSTILPPNFYLKFTALFKGISFYSEISMACSSLQKYYLEESGARYYLQIKGFRGRKITFPKRPIRSLQ